MKSFAVFLRSRSMISAIQSRSGRDAAFAGDGTAERPRARDEPLCDLYRWENLVDISRGDRSAQHAVVVGLGGLLRQDEAALRLHGFQSQAAVGAGTGHDDAYDAAGKRLGERVQQ